MHSEHRYVNFVTAADRLTAEFQPTQHLTLLVAVC